ncbi:hypothetical protein ACFOTA_21880 [Chitinophaga sp. GCM10012297]|uniref:DUF4890 domain-containing protein n=1 Tax=Chitinophaga chungangae TaxID=2821488 RepID=A0ABS3YJL8_9BACT|nr:hypothetical protein [Chitinophaga chungangae]MBO9154880.1 hypothetical protein [Chitinophaga chungangae]
MKNKTWSLLLLFIFAIGTAYAQDSMKTKKERWNAAGKADKLSDKLYRELNLSKDQHKKIYDINEDITKRRDAARQNTTLTSRQRMQVYQQLDAERNNRFKSVLTSAQYKKWNDWEMTKKASLEAKMDRKQDKRQARKADH